jgi:hypothetical protein
VYLACRALQGKVKLSLHESGRWHVGFDATRFNSMFEKDSEPPNRFAGKWDKPAPLIEGLTFACRVHIPWYAVTIPNTLLDGKVVWIQAAPQGQSIEVAIFLSEAGLRVSDWPGRLSMNTNLVGSFELDDGSHVWVVHHTIPLMEPKLPPTSAPMYFKGAGEQNLGEEGTRAVVSGDCEDGSVFFFEAPVSVTKNA